MNRQCGQDKYRQDQGQNQCKPWMDIYGFHLDACFFVCVFRLLRFVVAAMIVEFAVTAITWQLFPAKSGKCVYNLHCCSEHPYCPDQLWRGNQKRTSPWFLDIYPAICLAGMLNGVWEQWRLHVFYFWRSFICWNPWVSHSFIAPFNIQSFVFSICVLHLVLFVWLFVFLFFVFVCFCAYSCAHEQLYNKTILLRNSAKNFPTESVSKNKTHDVLYYANTNIPSQIPVPIRMDVVAHFGHRFDSTNARELLFFEDAV